MKKNSVLKMLSTFLTLCVFLLPATAQPNLITLNRSNIPLSELILLIEQQTNLSFFYTDEVNTEEKVSIDVQKSSLNKALNQLFSKSQIRYRIIGSQIILYKTTLTNSTPLTNSQSKQPAGNMENIVHAAAVKKQEIVQASLAPGQSGIHLRGVIRDENSQPLPYVTLIIKDTRQVATTGEDGNFSFPSVDPDAVLVASFVGYKTTETNINGRSFIEMGMEPDTKVLQDVVITGYQTLSRERATGSFSVITNESMKNKIQPSLTSRMEGMAAGFTSYKGEIRIRGTATLQGDAAPLYVINGLPYEGSLDAINPSEIENITILKDAAAASIYGARSANGVIVITTRGGQKNKTTVEYNNSFIISPLKDDRNYLKLMDSRELVNFQQEMFKVYHTSYSGLNKKLYLNDVSQLLYNREAGIISSDAALEGQLDIYRNRNNRNQLIDHFLRKTFVAQQHNLSLRGGTEKFTYAASINYSQNMPYTRPSTDILPSTYNLSNIPTLSYEKGYKNERIGYNIRTTYHFFSWLKADFSMIGSFTKAEYNRGFLASKYLNGGRASYQMIADEQGNPLKWYQNKSQAEINRLMALDLFDESFYPMQERDREQNLDKTNYFHINAGINAKLMEGLTLDLRFQTAKDYSYSAYEKSKDAYGIRTQVNDATQIVNGKIKYLIPPGGYISEGRSEGNYYVLRGQLNFDRTFHEKHNITAIAGTEINAKRYLSTYIEKYGYDPISLDHKYLDEAFLSTTQSGTESVNGSYTHIPNGYPKTFRDTENRYISFYGNASYTYDKRYSLTGSIKMEQSNLWGTDPKYQYRPFWHLGFTWKISNEHFMQNISWLDYLSLRATQGVNGQVPKDAGPYMIFASSGLNSWTQEYSNKIQSPPNSGLRWERTDVTNIGIDFRVLNNRLGGSIEWYHKKTSDLLSSASMDPTLGWSSLTMNYASMFNRGFELSLNSENIRSADFDWTTDLNFSYNKNKVTELQSAINAVVYYIQGNSSGALRGGNTREGMPLGTLYSFRWAGLDESGRPQVYKKDGSIAKTMTEITVEDLVENGTIIPPYSIAMSNLLRYKNLSLSFLLIYNGGHIMRNAMATYITSPESYNSTGTTVANMNKSIGNYWKTPADSNDPDKSPAIYRNASSNVTNLWYGADKHVLKADYLKLREITLSYSLPRNLLQKIYMQDLTLHAQVQNICGWSANGKGLDPEAWNGIYSSSTGPYPSRTPQLPVTYSLGLTLKF